MLSWYIDIARLPERAVGLVPHDWLQQFAQKKQGKKGREEIPSDYGMGNKETKNEKEVPPEVMMAESDEYLLDPPADEEPPEEPKPEPKWTEADKLADDL